MMFLIQDNLKTETFLAVTSAARSPFTPASL